MEAEIAALRSAASGAGEPAIDWQELVDSIVLEQMVALAESGGQVEAIYVTGSYLRGSWNRPRPNVNIYLIARPDRAPAVRMELGRLFHRMRQQLRSRSIDFMVDCHPYTVSERDPAWRTRPLLTLTTKVLEGERREERYRIAPSIGLGWYQSHRVVFGLTNAVEVFASPPVRDQAWLVGVHEAMCHYRNVLDHLPWALDWMDDPYRLLEESCRYAEEALRDGVHIGLTHDELRSGENIRILFDWATAGRPFYRDRYGDEGVAACDSVSRLKAAVNAGSCTRDEAEKAWSDALDVWSVVWQGYLRMARESGVSAPGLLKVTAWL